MKKTVSLLCAVIMLATSVCVASAKSTVSLPIVMYHHFSKDSKMLGKYTISPIQFEKDLIYLKNAGYTAVTATELLNYVNGGAKLPKKPCIITFDDGFESVYAYCLPLLKKYNMKAIIFIETSLADMYSEISDHNLAYSYLNWEYLDALNKSGYFEIGCHSHSMHKIYPRQGISQNSGESIEHYRNELTNDTLIFKEKLKTRLNLTTTFYAPPFGAYNENTLKILKDLNFNTIFTCTESVNRIARNEPLPPLGRFNRASGITSEQFFSQWK